MARILPVVVDSRIHVPGGLHRDIRNAIKRAFKHNNPDFFKKKNMGYRTFGIPRQIKTFREGDKADGYPLELPRGGFRLLRELLDAEGIRVRVVDRTTKVPADFPTFRVDPDHPDYVLRPYQREALAACIERGNGIVRAPTGCLIGATKIGINRGGKSFTLPLSEVVRRFNGGVAGGKTWRSDIATMVRSHVDGYIRLAEITAAVSSGIRPVFTVTVGTRCITATTCHRFLTREGWRRLDELTLSDEIAVEGSRRATRSSSKREHYPATNGLPHHPFCDRRGVNPAKGGHSVPRHRLVYEAAVNGLDFDDFIARIKKGEIDGLDFVDPKRYAIHHRDRDHLNNEISNLEKLTHAEHRAAHADENANNVQIPCTFEPVVEIVSAGSAETFDLTVPGSENFVANGVVAHNSGKTTIALAAIAALGQRAIVLLRDGQLAKQWIREIERCLDIPKKEIGEVRGGKKYAPGKRITVALQQSLYRKGNRLDELLRDEPFGTVVVDEVQGAAARTFLEVIDHFPARHRLGFSADETRKDGKEFLTYDVFGNVIYEIERGELEAKGHVLPVTVRMVPTDFRADWYRDAPPAEKDWTRLTEEIADDDERNDVIVRTIIEALDAGEKPTFVWTARSAHARELADERLFELGRPCGLMLGGTGARAERFDEARLKLGEGILDVATGTFKAIGVGINLPAIAAGIVASPIGNNPQYFNQVRGRLVRPAPGKSKAIMYYVWDRYVWPEHYKKLKKWNGGDVEIFGRDGLWHAA